MSYSHRTTFVFTSFVLLAAFIVLPVFADTNIGNVPVGFAPASIAVNPVTNMVYVANGNGVTVINGQDNSTATIALSSTGGIGVNPVTNKIYVANYSNHSVTVINGINNSTVTIPAGTHPLAVA